MLCIFIVVGLLVFLFLIISSIGFYFFYLSQNPKFSKKKLFKKEIKLSNSKISSWFDKIEKEEAYLKSFDNLNLHAYKINNRLNNWVIILHGYTNNSLDILETTKKFYRLGYKILLIDQRAHGKSEGKFSTLGWYERKDLINWINYIKEDNNRIILYGISMGANTVMMTIGEELPKNVICAIEDCGYVSIYDQFYNQLKYMKLFPRPIIYFAHFIAKIIMKFNIYKIDSLKQIKKGKIPVLFIHGEKDKFVPLSNLYLAFDNYNGHKEKLLIQGAKHMKSSTINPCEYWRVVERFIKKYSK